MFFFSFFFSSVFFCCFLFLFFLSLSLKDRQLRFALESFGVTPEDDHVRGVGVSIFTAGFIELSHL